MSVPETPLDPQSQLQATEVSGGALTVGAMEEQLLVWVGVIASVIAAIGVVWERWHWWTTRPRSDLRLKVLNRTPKYLQPVMKNGEWSASLKNWGTEVALGVGLIGHNCTLYFDREKLTQIDPLHEVHIGVDVDPAVAGTAWVSLHWSTPAMRNTMAAAWFPISERGALAQVYLRQMRRNAAQRYMARRLLGKVATPLTVPTTKNKAPKLHEPVVFSSPPQRRLWRLRGWWKRSWARAFRIVAPPEAWQAVESVEQQLRERLSEPSEQPGDPAPENESERLRRIFDSIGRADPFKNIPDPFAASKNAFDPPKVFDQVRRARPSPAPETPDDE